MAVVTDLTSGFSVTSPMGEKLGTITSSDLDLSTGNVFSDAPSSNVTYTFSNAPASGIAYALTFKVTPSAAITVTLSGATFRYAKEVIPDAPANGKTNIYVLETVDAGASFTVLLAGQDMA
jgi:hypothetical protein